MNNLCYWATACILAFLFTACASSDRPDDNNSTHVEDMESRPLSADAPIDEAEPESKPQTVSHEAINNLVIKELSGKETGRIVLNNGEINLTVGSSNIRSELKGDKRKYYNNNGQQIAEIKYKGDSFKLRTPSGELLWKIKLYGDKIKISDNEENQNPYEIKKKDSGKVKIYFNDNEIGQTKFRTEKGISEISGNRGSFIMSTASFSMAFSLVLAEDIPQNQQYIIMAELLNRGL